MARETMNLIKRSPLPLIFDNKDMDTLIIPNHDDPQISEGFYKQAGTLVIGRHR